MASSNKQFRLWKVWTTLKQMCHDRGYRVTREMMEMSFEDWKAAHGEKTRSLLLALGVDQFMLISGFGCRKELSFPVQKLDDDADQMIVFFAEEKDVGTPTIKSLYARCREDACFRAIIVYQNKVAPMARRNIDILLTEDPPYIFEPFSEAELVFNVTRHMLVPLHEVLTPQEKDQLLRRYNVTEQNLPCMQRVDPIARYFGLRKGQIVRIVRSSKTAGRYVTYRIVAD
eukprot:TRINITY_DN6412_c0_g1_i2.p1 TRINITY_DN6412_c0_g1~~TRINITY_DN6412_c0_g1_i2.p1  ORF type:complete len:244 (+),score=17.18 TRINITY_DN6412_c0_g1_i2:48-734(+)